MSKNHRIKCDTVPFRAIESGIKSFEFRKNDRDYRINDHLILMESINGNPTGYIIEVGVGWILYSGYGLPEGYCILSIFPIDMIPRVNKVKWEE